jgi:serine/threonine-protein kinase HipA
MRKARVLVNNIPAGTLEEVSKTKYRFIYHTNYQGSPISLALPIHTQEYTFNRFPACFEGLLPEGVQLEELLRKYKLNKTDYFGQLLRVGGDLVGALTVEKIV